MTKAIAALILVFTVLFLLSTFPQSPQARDEAVKDQLFSEKEIDDNYRLSVQRGLIGWARIFVTLGFLVTLAATSRARRLADRFERWTGGRWWLTVLLMGAFCFVCERLLRFPLAVLSLENWRAWKMTAQPFTDWLVDYGKNVALEAILGTVLLLGFYALLRWSPRFWWALAAALAGVLATAFAWLLPIWIEPLFNTFTPLSQYTQLDEQRDLPLLDASTVGLLGTPLGQGPLLAATALVPGRGEQTRKYLEASIRALAERAGVPVSDVLVMDASRRSSHTNAYFTGFGSTRRIILYDTLLRNHTPAEVVSILGHEIGHWQHHHIVIGLALGIVTAFFALWLLNILLRWAVNRRPFLLKSPADPASWPFILLLAFLGSWLSMPVQNAISRSFERQADWSALELTQQPEVFIAAERKMARDNRSNLAPNPFAVFWFYTHPPTLERIDMAREWMAEH